jgi:hypothetical protein
MLSVRSQASFTRTTVVLQAVAPETGSNRTSQKNIVLNKLFHTATQAQFNRPTVGMLWFVPLEIAVGCAVAMWYHS